MTNFLAISGHLEQLSFFLGGGGKKIRFLFTCARHFPVDLMLSESKICVCAHNAVDLIILESRVGVCVQEPVELQFFRKIWKKFKRGIKKSENNC